MIVKIKVINQKIIEYYGLFTSKERELIKKEFERKGITQNGFYYLDVDLDEE